MSDPPKPPTNLQTLDRTNIQTDGVMQIPVVRDPNYLRLSPTNMSAFYVKPTPPSTTPTFNLFLQVFEMRELSHHVNVADFALKKKDTLVQITEIAGMTLSLGQLRSFKDTIDNVLVLWDRDTLGSADRGE